MGDLFNLNKTRVTRVKGTTTTMANNSKTNVTAADVVAQAAEENLVEKTVPTQDKGEKTEVTVNAKAVSPETEKDDKPELTVLDGGKKSFKERMTALAKKVEENKKVFVAVGIAAAAATVAVAKVVAKRSLEKEAVKAQKLETMSDEELAEVESTEQYESIKNKAVATDVTAA